MPPPGSTWIRRAAFPPQLNASTPMNGEPESTNRPRNREHAFQSAAKTGDCLAVRSKFAIGKVPEIELSHARKRWPCELGANVLFAVVGRDKEKIARRGALD